MSTAAPVALVRLSLLSTLGLGCAHAPARETGTPVAPEVASQRLADVRSRLASTTPRSFRVSATLHEGRSGRTLSARGALALSPPDALRMQLVGPAGALALDVWIRGQDDRLAVPALDRVERSGAARPEPGRPVAFLRWWVLSPLSGELLRASDVSTGTRYELRTAEGAAVEAVVSRDGRSVQLVRRTESDVETVSATDAPCGEATYESAASKLRVAIRCEGEAPAPSPRAFDDPDEAP